MTNPIHGAPQTETLPPHGLPQTTSLPDVNYKLLRELLCVANPDVEAPATVRLAKILTGRVPPFAGWRHSESPDDVELRRWWVSLETSLKQLALELHVSHTGVWYVARAKSEVAVAIPD